MIYIYIYIYIYHIHDIHIYISYTYIHTYLHTHTHSYIYMYIYIYTFIYIYIYSPHNSTHGLMSKNINNRVFNNCMRRRACDHASRSPTIIEEHATIQTKSAVRKRECLGFHLCRQPPKSSNSRAENFVPEVSESSQVYVVYVYDDTPIPKSSCHQANVPKALFLV